MSKIASTYAKALYDIALEENVLEEVKNDEGNKLDEPTRYLAVLSVLMGNQGICAYEEVQYSIFIFFLSSDQ